MVGSPAPKQRDDTQGMLRVRKVVRHWSDYMWYGISSSISKSDTVSPFTGGEQDDLWVFKRRFHCFRLDRLLSDMAQLRETFVADSRVLMYAP